MRYDVAVGETGARSGIPHPSAHRQSSPLSGNYFRAVNGWPYASRPSNLGIDTLPGPDHRGREASPINNHHPALRAIEGSLTRAERSRRITAFLIDTLPIRKAPNSFPVNKCAHSNRHSSETLARTQFRAPNSDFATQTTRPQLPVLPANLLCYSFLVTRVPPNGLRASAPARSHGCGVDVSLPCNVRTTGAFPHKFTYSTGLMGLAGFVLRDWPGKPFGFRSPESPVGNAGVKEKSCES